MRLPNITHWRRTLTGLLMPVLDTDLLKTAGGFGIRSYWDVWCTRPDGSVRWAEYGLPNLMPDEGEQWLLQVAFSEEAAVPAAFEVGLTLDNAGGIDEFTTETTVADGVDGTEPSGNGYARQALNSDAVDWTVELDAGDYWARSIVVTFTAAGGPIPVAGNVDFMFLTTGGAGILVAAVALSIARSIPDGDSLNTSIRVKASE